MINTVNVSVYQMNNFFKKERGTETPLTHNFYS